MRLITAHRILIAAGLALFVVYAAVQLRLFVPPLARAHPFVPVAGGPPRPLPA